MEKMTTIIEILAEHPYLYAGAWFASIIIASLVFNA